jgi:hypothetical protein
VIELSDYVPVNLISLGVLGALGLRRLIRMDGHHELRVAILTGLLWALALYLFAAAYLPTYPDCEPTPGVRCAYSCVLN